MPSDASDPSVRPHLGWGTRLAPNIWCLKYQAWNSSPRGLRSLEMAALASPLLPKAEVRDARRPVERLRRVVEAQCGDGRSRQRLHLDAGPVSRADRRPDEDPAVRGVRFDHELRACHSDRMAERKQLRRPL